MHKYLLILFAVACEVSCRNSDADANIGEYFRPVLNRTVRATATDRKEDSTVSAVNMNGNYNYHANHQVFFINGSPQKSGRGAQNCVSLLERDDYIIKPGMGAYKYHSRRQVWSAAQRSCLEEGGRLAILNTDEEEKFLLEWIQREKVDEAWLGIHDLFEEGEWITLTGESLDVAGFERWATKFPNLPDNWAGNQNCGVLIKEGGLDDVDCNLRNPYFCELTLC